MSQQEALSALFKQASRSPVDVNLGQVPITPTIGRHGNYTVFAGETPKDNAALEISRALGQLPQILGQARNISAASGAQQAEQLSLDELEKRFNNGDVDAKGTMTWLGADKAFQEAAYKRLADANITPMLTKVSSEIDTMSHADLLKFKSDDDIKAYAQKRLVGSLDSGVMDTIKGNPWMEIRHNRHMEAIMPEYVQKASASVAGRKHAFKVKENLAAVETNFYAQSNLNLADIEPAGGGDDALYVGTKYPAQVDPDQMWIDNFQYAINFATEQGDAGGLDKFQIESKLMPALTAKVEMMVEDEQFSEATLVVEAAESGDLKINGRPLNQSTEGMKFIERAESLIERYSEEGDKIDVEWMDSHKSGVIKFITAEKVKDGYDPDSLIFTLQKQQDEVINDAQNPRNDKEIIELSNFYARARDGLKGQGEIHSETSDEKRAELGEDFKVTYTSVTPEALAVSIDKEDLQNAFLAAEGTLDFWENHLTKTLIGKDVTVPGKVVFQNRASRVLGDAAEQASRNTIAFFIDRPKEELYLGQVTGDRVEAQSVFSSEVSKKGGENLLKEAVARLLGLQEEFHTRNPPETPEDKEKREQKSAAMEQKRRQYRRVVASGDTLTDSAGNITPQPDPDFENYATVGQGVTQGVFYYPLPAANATFNNEIGRVEFKSAPVKDRLNALKGIAKEASDLDRVTSVAVDIESVLGQDQEGALYDKELELVKHSGLPLNTLVKDDMARVVAVEGGWFSEDTEAAILYNKYEHYNDPEETKKRVFNLEAILVYIRKGNDKRLRAIHETLLKDKMTLKDFINNQVTFFESFAGEFPDAQTPQQNPFQTNK